MMGDVIGYIKENDKKNIQFLTLHMKTNKYLKNMVSFEIELKIKLK